MFEIVKTASTKKETMTEEDEDKYEKILKNNTIDEDKKG